MKKLYEIAMIMNKDKIYNYSHSDEINPKDNKIYYLYDKEYKTIMLRSKMKNNIIINKY